jgi:hypothetical protein
MHYFPEPFGGFVEVEPLQSEGIQPDGLGGLGGIRHLKKIKGSGLTRCPDGG